MSTTTPASQARALLHATPNGGLAVQTGRQEAFDAIECAHLVCPDSRIDCYVYADADSDSDLILAIPYEGEEFDVLAHLPEDAE